MQNPIINPAVEEAKFLEVADRQAALRDYESALARVRVAMNERELAIEGARFLSVAEFDAVAARHMARVKQAMQAADLVGVRAGIRA